MLRTFFTAALILFGTTMAMAEDRTAPVRFPAGATGTTIKGTVTGRDTISYTVGAQAGQQMSVRLISASNFIYFNIYAPGSGPGDAALVVGEGLPDINSYSDTLASSGTYTINVFLYRNAARRGERADFALDISVSALSDASAAVKGDHADGLEGGPDFLMAQTSGGVLNLRQDPGGSAPVVTAVPNRTNLKNLGCRMNEGRRWCRVATLDGPTEGWAAGDYLVEGAYAAPAPDQPDALVPGTSFNATGSLPCIRYAGQPIGDCAFGVTRNGDGSGTITITWPDGGERIIGYQNNRPTWYDQSEADGGAPLEVTQQADTFTVAIGSQRFQIVEAIMAGG